MHSLHAFLSSVQPRRLLNGTRRAWTLLGLLAVPASPAAEAPPPERVFRGEEAFTLWISTPRSRFKADLANGTVFDLDSPTLGLMAMSDMAARLNTKPAGLTLPLREDGPLTFSFTASNRTLSVDLRGGGSLASMTVGGSGSTVRVCLRQRDQFALLPVAPRDGPAGAVWVASVDYRLVPREGEQYLLCRDLAVEMEGRALTGADFMKGVTLDALDEAKDIVVSGLAPDGRPFRHRYRLDADELDRRVEIGLGLLFRTLREGGGEAAGGTAP